MPPPSYLPSPVTSYSSSRPPSSGRGWQSFLLQRARTTNLAVLLLGSLCAFSLLFNLDHWIRAGSRTGSSGSAYSIRATLPPAKATLTHLIIVPCHSIWIGSDPNLADRDDQWMLEHYQRGGSVPAWLSHIRRGIDEVVSDPASLLVFSGGQTRPNVPFPGLSEASSYARLAAALTSSPSSPAALPDSKIPSFDAYWHAGQRLLKTPEARRTSGVGDADRGKIFARATTEEFALDSLSNVLFSIARFKEVTDRYPSKITVVGYAFKAHRFLHSHLPSLLWPTSSTNYIGIDGDLPSEKDRGEERYGGEREVLEEFSRDRYACFQEAYVLAAAGPGGVNIGKDGDDGNGKGGGEVVYTGLGGKRRRRNPGRRWHGYLASAPEIRGLMEWCPSDGTTLYPGRLPWTS